MSELPEIDFLPPDLPEIGQDMGNLLNENVARIELLKMKILEWPGLGDLELGHILRELDILRGTFIQAMSIARPAYTEPEHAHAVLPGNDDIYNLKLEGIIGQNRQIAKVLKIISRVAATDLTIPLGK
jgi:hypothetical protein